MKRFSPFFLCASVRSVRRRRLSPRQVGLPSDLLLSKGPTWIYIVRALVAVVIARALSSRPTFELFAPTAKSLIVHQVPRCPALLRGCQIHLGARFAVLSATQRAFHVRAAKHSLRAVAHPLRSSPSPSPPNRLPHLGVIASFLPHFYVFRSVIVSWPAAWSNTAASCANLRIKVTAFPRAAFSESGLCARVLCLCVCARALRGDMVR